MTEAERPLLLNLYVGSYDDEADADTPIVTAAIMMKAALAAIIDKLVGMVEHFINVLINIV